MSTWIKNSLTPKQKLSIPRLIQHDLDSISQRVINYAVCLHRDKESSDTSLNKIKANSSYIAAVYYTVHLLTQYDEIPLNELNTSEKKLAHGRFNNFLKYIPNLVDSKIEIQTSPYQNFSMNDQLMFCILHNLIKNGISAQAPKNKAERGIELVIQSYLGFPQQALLVPRGAEKYNEFMRFSVHNEGNAFPEKILSKDYLKKFVHQKGQSGFGLYFVKLAAKLLKAPIEISSKPGDTTVSFYHPIYNSE